MFLLLKPPPTSSSSPPSSLSNGSSLHCFVLETNQRRRSIKLPAAKSKLVLYHSTSSLINTNTQIQKYKEQIHDYRIGQQPKKATVKMKMTIQEQRQMQIQIQTQI